MDNVLFGDFVIIYGQLDNDPDNQMGVMSSSGFSNSEVYAEKIEAKQNQSKTKGIARLRNYRQAVFQIWPKLDYEAHKEFASTQKLLNQLKKNQLHEQLLANEAQEQPTSNKQVDVNQSDISYLEERLYQLQIKMSQERENNLKQLDMVKNTTLTYGQEMFLMHKDSRQFLCGTIIASDNFEKAAYKFEVSSSFCRGMIFKILPRFKMRQEGEAVQYSDQLLIHNIKLNSKTNFTKAVSLDSDGRPVQVKTLAQEANGSDLMKPYYREMHLMRNFGRTLYSCFLSNEQEVTWQFIKHSDYIAINYIGVENESTIDKAESGQGSNNEDADQIIRGSDLVYIQHSENQGYLSADFSYGSDNNIQEVFIRKYEGEFKEEVTSISSIWEIEYEKSELRGQSIRILDRQLSGTTDQQGFHFRIRHFLTGKYLTADNKSSIPVLTRQDKDSDSSIVDVQLLTTTPDIEQMINNECYIVQLNKLSIIINEDELYQYRKGIDKKNQQQQQQEITDFKQVTENMIYDPLDDVEFCLKRYQCKLEAQLASDENSFQIFKLMNKERQELLQAYSSFCTLQSFLQQIKAAETIKKETYRKVIKCLEELIYFVFQKDKETMIQNRALLKQQQGIGKANTTNNNTDNMTNQKDATQSGAGVVQGSSSNSISPALTINGLQNNKRQHLLKDFQLLELLTDILYYPFKLGTMDIKQMGQADSDFILILKLSYCLIRHTIKEYRPNELYASQWLNLMIIQSMLTDNDSDIGAEEALTELIDNNKRILESKIHEETIIKFVKMLREEKEDKYVKLLRAIVVCDQQAVVQNQGLVSKFLLEDISISQELIPPLRFSLGDEGKVGGVKCIEILDNLDGDNRQQQSAGSKRNKSRESQDIRSEQMLPIDDEPQQDRPIKKYYLPLAQFGQQSEINDQRKHFDYYVELVLLMADLCLDRNYRAIEPLEKVFPQDICIQIVSDGKLEPELRQAFTNLTYTLWVDRAPYNYMKLPERIKVWTELEGKNEDKNSSPQLQCTREDISHLSKLKTFIEDYLQGSAKRGYISSLEHEKNQLLLSVLQLCKLITSFGFFQTPMELKGILQSLLLLLNSTKDVTSDVEQRFADDLIRSQQQKGTNTSSRLSTRNSQYFGSSKQQKKQFQRFTSRYQKTEDTIIVHSIKDLICKILRIIVQLRCSLQVNLFLKEFKARYQSFYSNTDYGQDNNQFDQQSEDKSIDEYGSAQKKPLYVNIQGSSADYEGSGKEESQQKSNTDGQKDVDVNLKKDLQALQTITQILERKDIDMVGSSKVDIVTVLFDLTLYDSPELVNEAFFLLNEHFSQRKSFFTLLSQIQLIEDRLSIELHQELCQLTQELSDLVEKSENWLYQKGVVAEQQCHKVFDLLQKTYNAIQIPKNRNRIGNQFLEIKEEPEAENIPQGSGGEHHNSIGKVQIGGKETIFQNSELLKEDHVVNEVAQQLLHNNGLYQVIVNILKFDADNFTSHRSGQQQPADVYTEEGISKKILQICYKILGLFVMQDEINQALLMPYVFSVFIKHIQTFPELQVNCLMKYLVQNNKAFLSFDQITIDLVHETARAASRLLIKSNYSLAASYLDILKGLMKYKQKVLKFNQTVVITEISQRNVDNLIITMGPQEQLTKQLESDIVSLSKSLSSYISIEQQDKKSASNEIMQQKGNIVVPGLVDYFVSLLELISLCCEENNHATESKAQLFFTVERLKLMFDVCKDNIYLKRWVYFFFFHVYLETEKEMDFELAVIKKFVFSQIIEDLKAFNQLISNADTRKNFQNVAIKTYNSSTTLNTLIFDLIFDPLFLCIINIVKKSIIEQKEERIIFANDVIKSFSSLQHNQIVEQLFEDQQQIDKIKYLLSTLVMINLASVENLSNIYQKQFIPTQESIYIAAQNTLVRSQKESSDLQGKSDQKQAQSIVVMQKKPKLAAQNLRKILKQLQRREELQTAVKDELGQFVDAFLLIRKRSEMAFLGVCNITFSELATSLIRFQLTNVATTSIELSIKRLQLLRQIIELENKEHPNTPSAEWHNDDYQPFLPQIQVKQNLLLSMNIVSMIVTLINNAGSSATTSTSGEERELIMECLLLSSALLLGGNSKAQDEFYRIMQNDSSNKFLIMIKEMLQKTFISIKKSMTIFNKKRRQQRLIKMLNQKQQQPQPQVPQNQPATSGNASATVNQQSQDNNKQNANTPQEIELTPAKTLIKVNEQEEDDEEITNPQKKQLQGGEGASAAASKEETIEILLEEDDVKDMIFLQRIFRFLQLFCEGHKLELQDYLREQIVNGSILSSSQDFIFTSSMQFGQIIKFMNEHCVDVGQSILNFLIECIQGPCQQNQITLCRGKVIDTCKDLFQSFMKPSDFYDAGFQNEEQRNQLNSFIKQSTLLLFSLIEGFADKEIITTLCSSLDLQFLTEKLEFEYQDLKRRIKYQDDDDDIEDITNCIGKQFDDELMSAFNIFLLILTLSEHQPDIKDVIENNGNKKLQAALNFFRHHTGSIEIKFQGQLLKVYFPIQPVCRNLSRDTRKKLMNEVPRESPNEKIQGLMQACPQLFVEMEHLSYLKSLIFDFSAQRFNLCRDISTIISSLITILMLIQYSLDLKGEKNFNSSQMIRKGKDFSAEELINILGYIQLVTSSMMLIFYIVINGPLIIKQGWDEVVSNYKASLPREKKFLAFELDQPLQSYSQQQTTQILFFYGPDADIFNSGKNRSFGHFFTTIMYYWTCFTIFFTTGSFAYQTVYILISCLGTFVSDLCYSFHLIDVVNRSPSLQNVIKAVTTNFKQLVLTLILGIVGIYIFSFIAFYFINDVYSMSDIVDYDGSLNLENTCEHLLQCFITTINFGLIKGGGIGDVVKQIRWGSDIADKYAVTYLFNLLFFLVIKMAILNIVFGIIVDTFAELRDKKSKIDEDMNNVCFICGIERTTFDQFADGFENHIDRDHHLWNYIYYIYHLVIKDITDLNGIESYIYQQYNNEEFDWFPLLKSISLKNQGEENQEEDIDKQVDRIKSNLSIIQTVIDSKLKSKQKEQEAANMQAVDKGAKKGK